MRGSFGTGDPLTTKLHVRNINPKVGGNQCHLVSVFRVILECMSLRIHVCEVAIAMRLSVVC